MQGYMNYDKLVEEIDKIEPDPMKTQPGESFVDEDMSVAEYNKGAEFYSTYKNHSVNAPNPQ
jgi:hypothetical protein